MASRTRTVNPRTKQPASNRQAPPAINTRNKSPTKGGQNTQQKTVHQEEGFTVVEPDANRRQRILNAANREEAQVRQHHNQRRQEVIQLMNHSGPTSNRLGGGNINMEEVRRRQVEAAEAALRKNKNFQSNST